MKTLRLTVLSLVFVMGGAIAVSGQQNRIEVPGDYFSLEGALELFKKSSSPEDFERLLNSSNSKVNNLDLNGDGEIDYIRVISRNEGNVHTFTLQAIVSPTESQDVAVIALEKLANGKAVLHITGDEDVYGIETIIEPTEEVRINAGTSTARNVVNVWTWPSVQYVYSPYYSTWVSPWSWHRRPIWWSSWRPVSYYEYYGWWQPYRPYYTVCHTPRIVYAHRIYRPYRTTSVVVYNRHYTQITNYRSVHRDDRDRRSSNIDDRNGRTWSYTDEGTNRNRNDKVRSERTVYEDRSNNRQYNNVNRTTPDRQRTYNDQGNSRPSPSVSSPAQQQDRSYTNRRNESAPVSKPDVHNKPHNGQRNTGMQPRNEGSKGRTGEVTINRGAPQPQRESRPSVSPDRSRPSENSEINRPGQRNGKRVQ
ncbi:MAG: hypothetical protein KF687_11530 [Cyclobacteriaceae bacterium]|nr:hypothetical protein [Cyclobacteriaceae bacterium]